MTLSMNRPQLLFKPLVFLVALAPCCWLVFALLTNRLGANPIEAITHFTGTWALRFVLLGLALTPLRLVLKRTWPQRLRRMIGLFAFFYACLHLLTYLALDQQWDWADIVVDVIKRPYIAAGSVAFLLLMPLALTSTKKMMRRLGKRWLVLHRIVYLMALVSVLHYIWLAKGDILAPYVYLMVLVLLLLVRFKTLLGRK